MKNKVLMMMALLLMVTGIEAQKIDQRLTRLAEQSISRRAQAGQVDRQKVTERIAVGYAENGSIRSVSVQAYLKEGTECPTEQLEQMGITVRFVVDNVAVLSVPVDKVAELENIDEILFAKADDLAKFTNDKARVVTHVDQVADATKATAAGLSQAFTGKDVVLGIIDGGIDFNHKAFQDYASASRIKRVMIFSSDDGTNTKYTTPEDIKKLQTDFTGMSHGTHTLAIAAGTDQFNGLMGMAPEADIVAVGIGKTTSESNISEGIKFISQYADEVKKPCVITISLGKETDLHDGSSLVAKTVKEITNNGEKAGKAVLISASNSANHWGSIVKTLEAPGSDGYQLKAIMGCDNDMSELDPEIGGNPDYSNPDIFIYAADGKDFTAEIKIVDIKTGTVTTDQTGLITDGDLIDPQPKTIALTKISNYPTASGGTAVVYKASLTGKYELKNFYDRLAIFVKGTQGQVIKMINSDEEAKEHNFFLPAALEGKGYTAGDNKLSISTYVCNDAVISVGSTVSRNEWDYYEAPKDKYIYLKPSKVTGEKPKIGDVSDFSSYCIADDNGKAYPTVLAPGESINSAYNYYDITSFIDGEPNPLNPDIKFFLCPITSQVYETTKRVHWYGAMSGTSMACPHAAGIVALWMQADPTLTVNKIKNIMNDTSLKLTVDKCPSKDIQQAGYGVIDALAGLKKIKNASGIEKTDASKLNDEHSAVYNMKGQQVDKSQKGLVIYKGRKYVNK